MVRGAIHHPYVRERLARPKKEEREAICGARPKVRRDKCSRGGSLLSSPGLDRFLRTREAAHAKNVSGKRRAAGAASIGIERGLIYGLIIIIDRAKRRALPGESETMQLFFQ